MKMIVNNLATEYTDEGRGPALLMLPGWMNDIHNFDALASRLSTDFRVVRLDLPGFGGGTEAPPDTWGVSEYASFTKAFIEKIGLESYTLVGHSFGGRVTIKGTGEGVLSPTGIVLIASAGIAKHRTLKNRTLTILAKMGKVALHIPPLSLWRRQLRRKLYTKLKSDYFAAGALSQVYRRTIREDLREYARKIRVPSLLIWGSDDEMVPLSDGRQFNELIAGSKLAVLPGVGHSPHRDRPEEVASLIKEFL
ncbi:MAG: alpha/beta hydrolase [Patescibacteria group bacterium]|nr:alpha/beta hydrolase [Patescibacteria group bacterium]